MLPVPKIDIGFFSGITKSINLTAQIEYVRAAETLYFDSYSYSYGLQCDGYSHPGCPGRVPVRFRRFLYVPRSQIYMEKKLTKPGQNATISSPDTNISCDTIEGTLTVSESFSGVLNLTGINEIKGDLTVTNVGGITKINLPALEKVEGSVTVTDNNELTNLTLSGLQSVNGGLTVQGNGGLSYVGLQNLEDVEGGGLTLVGDFRYALFPRLNSRCEVTRQCISPQHRPSQRRHRNPRRRHVLRRLRPTRCRRRIHRLLLVFIKLRTKRRRQSRHCHRRDPDCLYYSRGDRAMATAATCRCCCQ